MIRIGRTTLLVDDLDAARAFYVDAFGFNVLFDGEVAPGLRTVHVGPGAVHEPGLWLIRATSDEARARIGRQTGGEPALVFYTDDLTGTMERLGRMRVSPHIDPRHDDSGASFAHVRDISGNEIVIVQLPSESSTPS